MAREPALALRPNETKLTEAVIAVVAVLLATVAVVETRFLALTALIAITPFLVAAAFQRKQWLLDSLVFSVPLAFSFDIGLAIHDFSSLFRLLVFLATFATKAWRGESLSEWITRGKITRYVLAFSLISLFSAAVANDLTATAERALFRDLSNVMFYFVLIDWVRTKEQVRRVLNVLMASTIAISVYGIYQFVVGDFGPIYYFLYSDRNEYLIEPWMGRVASVFLRVNPLAGYLAFALCVTMAAVAYERGRQRTLSIATLVISTPVLLLTQSRGGVAAFAVAVLLAIFTIVPKRFRVRTILLLSALGAGVGFFVLHFAERMAGIDEFTTVTRFLVWAVAFSMFRDSPMFGIGYGNFREAYANATPDMTDPLLDTHNLYLKLLAETGIVGFLIYGAMILVIARQAWVQVRTASPVRQIVGFGMLAGIVTMLVHGSVDVMLDVLQYQALFYLLVALLVVVQRIPQES